MKTIKLSIFSIIFLHSVLLNSQSSGLYHKAKIKLEGKSIDILSNLGMETDHGIYIKNKSFESDFSIEELEQIKSIGLDYEVLIRDVSAYYQNVNRPSYYHSITVRTQDCEGIPGGECEVRPVPVPANYAGGSMGGYRTYNEMLRAIDSMTLLYPNLISPRVEMSDFMTHDSNFVFYIKLSDNPLIDEGNEPQVLYTALHHAREPNSLDQMLFFLWHVLENYGTDPDITYMVDHTEMYFVPCVNPDGYKINERNSPAGGGLWRKNGRKDANGTLVGVDLNRNYGFKWGIDNEGSSATPSSQTYRGTAAFSEPETQAVKALCESKNFLVALNYHTFGNLLVHPWGYNDLVTDEDKVFKDLASEMTYENCYITGTGTETVGYVVNGDSDDWMYGEQTTKAKIYSMTPEAGYSFWPSPSDIITINQSCIRMNMRTAQLTRALFEYTSDSKTSLSYLDNSVDVRFRNVGLAAGTATVSIKSLDPMVNMQPVFVDVILLPGQDTSLKIPITFANGLKFGMKIPLEIKIKGEGYENEFQKSYTFIEEAIDILYETNFTNLSDWNTPSHWGLEDVNGINALSDSPNAIYESNLDVSVSLDSLIDLSKSEFAMVNFKAKWDIENNYDYVVFEASVNGVDYIPLCGVFTNPGAEDQIEDQPLYDGVQDEFIDETIILSEFLGAEKVRFRFRFVSDGFEERNGMLITNFVIKSKSTPSGIDELDSANLYVYPNPSTGLLQLSGIERNVSYQIYSIEGSLWQQGHTEGSIDGSKLPNGVYYLSLQNGDRAMFTILR